MSYKGGMGSSLLNIKPKQTGQIEVTESTTDYRTESKVTPVIKRLGRIRTIVKR